MKMTNPDKLNPKCTFFCKSIWNIAPGKDQTPKDDWESFGFAFFFKFMEEIDDIIKKKINKSEKHIFW